MVLAYLSGCFCYVLVIVYDKILFKQKLKTNLTQ